MSYINEDNFYRFALYNLKSKYLIESEFRSLLKHIVYIKRLFRKYKDNPKNINVNLLINHFIIIYNEFEIKAANEILFYQINPLYYPQLKTILYILNKIHDDEIIEINDDKVKVAEIMIDKTLEKTLLEII